MSGAPGSEDEWEETFGGVVDPSQYAPPRALKLRPMSSLKLRRTPEAARAFGAACAQLEPVLGFVPPQSLVLRALERVFIEGAEDVAGLRGFPSFTAWGRAPQGPEVGYRDAIERWLAARIRVSLRRAPLPARVPVSPEEPRPVRRTARRPALFPDSL